MTGMELQRRSPDAVRAYGDGYLAALTYAIDIAGKPVEGRDARLQIIDRLQRHREGMAALHAQLAVPE